MTDVDWSVFTVMPKHGGARPDALATLSAFFYIDQPVQAVATALAEAIDAYVQLITLPSLSMYLAASGRWKPMTARALGKDLKVLRSFPPDYEAFEIFYDSDPVPGPFGVALSASNLQGNVYRNGTNILRLDFPAGWSREQTSLAQVRGLVDRILRTLPAQTANVGLAFKRTGGTTHNASRGVHQKLPRYLGFDPCYSLVRLEMRGKTFSAHWINYVSNDMADALGWGAGLTSALANCKIESLPHGLMIQGAKIPPIGDTNRAAKDLGCLPDVARALKPLRSPISAFGTEDFDAQVWLARMDDWKSQPWDNESAS